MKKSTQAVLAMVFAAALLLAFWAGSTLKETEQRNARRQRCQVLLSFAVDKLDNQDLSEQGIKEALVSDLYAAYEYCDSPELAAEIHRVWNTLVFDSLEDTNSLSAYLKTLSDALNAE